MNLSDYQSVFCGTLRAEQEPWLFDIFIEDEQAEIYKTHDSFTLYGTSGAGKTALRLFLQSNAPSHVLTVPWFPEPIANEEINTHLAQAAMRQAIHCLLDRLITVGCLAERLPEPPDWVAAGLAWYLRRYLPMDANFYVESLSSNLAANEIAWYQSILERPERPIFKEDISLNDQLRMLMRILNRANYHYVWWLVDGLEKWPEQADDYLAAMIESLLSTLSLFDVPQYVFKLFVPMNYQNLIRNTSGVSRHRVREIVLQWTHHQLTTVLEKRISFALNMPNFSLDNMVTDPNFFAWMEQHGGRTPRGWFSLAAPLVSKFQTTGQPLSSTDWNDSYQFQTYQQLRLLPDRREVQISDAIIQIGSEDGFKILHYLYKHSGKICSLEELYYCAIKELENVPKNSKDEHWVHKTVWRGSLDTILYRLRQKIEPAPDKPIYLVTYPRKGLELRHATL